MKTGGLTTLGTVGVMLLALGIPITSYFFLVYDTSLPDPYIGRIHNIGLMQDRLMGLLVGLAAAVSGLGCLVVDHVSIRKD